MKKEWLETTSIRLNDLIRLGAENKLVCGTFRTTSGLVSITSTPFCFLPPSPGLLPALCDSQKITFLLTIWQWPACLTLSL
ncbi:hypothetical protein CEXT_380201 [Caerostris extrusa]|uniref:Uncharacterized protein n=1 Tax=Caerostris extrusa TaxID=172846 RepID=A0AAV4SS42_CAEEX|nr:hypothetical protein CEXT_380201 [Caerostris extrusa]